MCLDNEAHGLELQHPIFRGPLATTPTLHDIATPAHYRSHWNGRDLGETMPAWQVQQSGYLTDQSVVPGVVAGPWAFTEGADTEYVASGVNSKGPRYPSLGRHGPFFQWGFSASPPQMTSEARRVFVNTICYIAKFDGQAPLTRKRTMHRGWALERAFGLRFLEERHASLVEHYEARKREYAAAAAVRDAGERALTAEEQYALKYPPRDAMSFDEYREMSLRGMPAELVERLGTTTESLEQYVSYYEQNLGYLRRADDGSGYVVDEDALALGIENRDPAILAHAVELLERGESDEQTRRAERLLRRYTGLELEDAASWRRWLDQVDGHLFFSDVGGFRFYCDDPELAARAGLLASAADVDDQRPVAIACSVSPPQPEPGSVVTVAVRLTMAEGWHSYPTVAANSAYQPIDIELDLPDGAVRLGDWQRPPGLPHPDEPGTTMYEGDVVLLQRVRLPKADQARPAPQRLDVRGVVRLQVCDAQRCLPPAEQPISVRIDAVPGRR